MLDFGTELPFNFAPARTLECWCALKLQLNQAHYVEEGGELRNYPERWAYFLWLPLINPEVLGQPDVWEIVDEIPYQQMFTTVWNAPIYMRDERDVDLVFFGRYLLEFGNCEDWLRTAIVNLVVEADRNPGWEGFWKGLRLDAPDCPRSS